MRLDSTHNRLHVGLKSIDGIWSTDAAGRERRGRRSGGSSGQTEGCDCCADGRLLAEHVSAVERL